MAIKRERVFEEVPLGDLLGKPAFWNSENSQDYERLRAAIDREMQPKTIFDQMKVQDVTDKCWEERRLKRSQIALINSAAAESLASLFAPHFGGNLEGALETAQNYYSGHPEKKAQAQKLIDQLAITPEQIEANAMHMRNLGVQMLDRMITHREAVRNRLIRDHERRLRKAEKAKRRTPINDNTSARSIGLVMKKGEGSP